MDGIDLGMIQGHWGVVSIHRVWDSVGYRKYMGLQYTCLKFGFGVKRRLFGFLP